MNVLLLASQSPRRRELLALGERPYDVAAANVDETPLADEAPRAYVLRLAREKARAAAGVATSGQIVIGSDTAVIDGNEILGKPRDAADAVRMLARLRGRTHQVFTAVAAFRPHDGKTVVDLCVTDVPMRAYSDDEIAAYVRTGDPLDKAGAYAIQHPDFKPVAEMRGCYAGVMGLPLCHLARILPRVDVSLTPDISRACQSFLRYECPVAETILRGE